MNDWGVKKGNWKDSSPIGSHARDFIDENCQFSLYLRRDARFKCPDHFSAEGQSSLAVNKVDAFCWGTGVKIIPQIVPCRFDFGGTSISPRESDIRQDPGFIQYFKAVVFFPRIVKPQLEDLICIVEWDKPTQSISNSTKPRILNITDVFLIKQINNHFERELSFFGCGLEEYGINSDRFSKAVNLVSNIKVLESGGEWQKSYW